MGSDSCHIHVTFLYLLKDQNICSPGCEECGSAEDLISVLLYRHPEMRLLDHVVVLFLSVFFFLETSILFSIVAAPFYISFLF